MNHLDREKDAARDRAFEWLMQLPDIFPECDLPSNALWLLGLRLASGDSGRPTYPYADRVQPAMRAAPNTLLAAELAATYGDAINNAVASPLIEIAERCTPEDLLYPTGLEVRVQLARVAACPFPSPSEWASWHPPAIAELWERGSEALVATARWYAASFMYDERASGYGEVLAGAMLSACRRYDIGLAADIRKALSGVAELRPACGYVDEFFLMQGSFTGYFGHVNPFKPNNEDPQSRDIARRLPMTVAILRAWK